MPQPQAVVSLPDFQRFLTARKLVPEKNIPNYAKWVGRFLLFSNSHPGLNAKDLVEKFLSLLDQDERIEDWQLRQASAAIAIYQNNFSGNPPGNNTPVSAGGQEGILEKIRDSMRLRHYSYRTEQATLAWAGRCRGRDVVMNAFQCP